MQVTTTSPLFSATLRPDRSLHAAGGWIGFALAGIVGTPFLIAVPELLLPGLTAFALAGATLVWLGVRQGRLRKQSQVITVWPDQLEITTAAHGQKSHLRRYPIHSVRLRLERDAFERTTGVFLRHDAEELELGGFLSSQDKSSFYRAFSAALRRGRKAV
jgi:uncharacterized membrane protein